MFVDGNIKLNEGMATVIDAAIADGAQIGALSVFDDKTTAKIMEKLELDKKGAETLTNGPEDKNVPSTDAWLKLAKTMKVAPSCCVAIASSSRSCKAALSAGMRCAVVPDKFTSFQDFSGADLILDSLDKDAVDSIIGLLDM
jgi:putative hydrolase of the HAD superfamily